MEITLSELNLLSISLLIFSGILTLIFTFFKYRVIEIAKKSSIESLKEYENDLKAKSSSEQSLSFRDDPIRNELTKYIATKSIEKKIGIWQDLYRLYFDYLKSWDFDKGTPLKEFKTINDNLKRNQKEILINTIYLGGPLTVLLSKLNRLLIESIRKEFYTNKKFNNPTWQKDLDLMNSEMSEVINQIQLKLSSTLFTDQSLKDYEFTREELAKISGIRKSQLEKFDPLTTT